MKILFLPVVKFAGLGALMLVFASVLEGCAKKDLETDFRPLQIQWNAESDDVENSPHKDACVIKLTSKLMGEGPVQASAIGEILYTVSYGLSKENAENLHFSGFCDDSSLLDLPECRWEASCEKGRKIVVKFHNGD